jgi:hypothetical protein
MKYLFFIPTFLISISFSCSDTGTDNNNTESASDNSTEKTVTSSVDKQADEETLQLIIAQKETIAAELEEGKISNYIVRNGNGFVAESTTFYRDDEKTEPCKTKIIYLTGGFSDVYWLTDGIVWVDINEYSHIFQNAALITSMIDKEETEISEQDKLEILKIPALAVEIITSKAEETE